MALRLKNIGDRGVKNGFYFTWGMVIAGVLVVFVVVVGGFFGVEAYTSSSEFCGGSCHTMDEQYAAWKKNKHHAEHNKSGKQAECIDCHFLPGGKLTMKAQFEGLRHLAAYLYDAKAPLPIHPKVPDGACLQSGCHDKAKLQNKEIKFSGAKKKNIRFKHKVHFSDKALDGKKLYCNTCHIKVTKEKHFEVPKEVCFLCHFKPRNPGQGVGSLKLQKVNFTKGPSKCENCHTIPTKSLQSQLTEGEKNRTPISHQTIQKTGVPCESCHFDIVHGTGTVIKGRVNSGGCLKCHNSAPDIMAKANDKKLMHDKHIDDRNALCFDCHEQIDHKARSAHLDLVTADCTLCHDKNQHKYQKALLAGLTVTDGVAGIPMLMDKVNLNCVGCHTKKVLSKTGHDVKVGSGKACDACHGDKNGEHSKMLSDWKNAVDKEVKGAEETETTALQALKDAEGVLPEDKLKEAREMIAKGQEILKVIKFGKGAHNKKYSMMLIDEVYGNFEDSIDLIESGK